MISFDGDNKVITLASGVSSVDASDIYSRWKDWAATADNAKFEPAFRVIGGDPLGGGQFAGSYFFLRNDYGWTIKPPEEDIVITVNGNLFPENPAAAFLVPTTGSFNTSIRLQTSSLTQVAEVNTGSGVGASDVTDIADAVMARILASMVPANVKQINDATVQGTGQDGDAWRGSGV